MQSTPPASKRRSSDNEGPPAVSRPGIEDRTPRKNENENVIDASELIPPPHVHQAIIPNAEGVGDLSFLENGVLAGNAGQNENAAVGAETPQVTQAKPQHEEEFEEELQGLAIVEKEDYKSDSLEELD